MAVQPWELVEEERPRALTLVQTAPAPPRGKPWHVALFVIFIVLALGTPSISAALEADPETPRWVARPRPATEVAAIDPLGPVGKAGRPGSNEPFAGLLFVRCTRLWSALPDGSHPRKILEMPGISSPALAPNARTVAFLVTTATGQELWMSGADGSDARRIGSLTTDGAPLLSQAGALTWSPKGDELAFALVDGRYGEFEGGAAIWTLDLTSGEFSRKGSGWPAPFWAGGKVAWASMSDNNWAQLADPWDVRNWLVRNLRTSKHDLSAALVPEGYSTNHARGAAVLRDAGDRPLLIVKDMWRKGIRKSDVTTEPPNGYVFAEHARPTISQNGSVVSIELVDRDGESDLGVFDTRRRRWTVLDYAWDPAASPAPTVSGPLGARRAAVAVEDLLSSWNGGGTRRNLVVTPADRQAFPFDHRAMGYVAQAPVRAGRAWSVPVAVYGFRGDQQWWRSASIVLSAERGRLSADITDLGRLTELATVGEALAFVESALGRNVAVPPLPSDMPLQRGSLWAYSYSGDEQITFNIRGARGSGQGGRGRSSLTFGFGRGLDFAVGCGGEVDPAEIRLGEMPAVIDSSGGMHQVIWPSTMEDRTGTYSVYGYGFNKKEIVDIAGAMASSTP